MTYDTEQASRMAEAMSVMPADTLAQLIAMGMHVVAVREEKAPKDVALELAEHLDDADTWREDPFGHRMRTAVRNARRMFDSAGVTLHTRLRRPQG